MTDWKLLGDAIASKTSYELSKAKESPYPWQQTLQLCLLWKPFALSCAKPCTASPPPSQTFWKLFFAFNLFLLLLVSSYRRCISRLIIPFPDFPIKVPGFGRFNAATEYVWTSLPWEFHCLENGFNQSWGSDKYEVWWAGILIHTSSDDNCSIALGSNGFPALSSLPSLKSWTILLP